VKVGEYEYPVEVTFADALKVADLAITKYNDKMSNKDVGEALGYKIKNPAAISGYIFRKFDEICMYNVMARERGFMVATDVAKEALDPYDPRKAAEGKVKAIRQIPIVKEAFTKWNGEIPQETAFPSKLVDLLSIQWQEAQKHAESLRKLFIELFPYLKATPIITDHGVGRDEPKVERSDMPIGYNNELRTEEYGILKIKDEVSIDMAMTILKSLKDKLLASKKKDMQKSS